MKRFPIYLALVCLVALPAVAQQKRVIRGSKWFEDNVSRATNAATARAALGITSTNGATGGVWGEITGTIGDQADLLAALTNKVQAGGNIGAATATTPAENDNDTSVATTAYVQTEIAGLGAGGGAPEFTVISPGFAEADAIAIWMDQTGTNLTSATGIKHEGGTNLLAWGAVKADSVVATNGIAAAGLATSGSTNATLTGNLRANGAVFTNSVTAVQLLGTSANISAILSGALSFNSDTFLLRDGAANTLALRNSTSAQTLNVYHTYTDASNYERGALSWGSSKLTLKTAAAGTGTVRNLELDGAQILFNTGSGGLAKWYMTTSGHFIAANDNLYDIGAPGATRPRNVYVAGTTTIGGVVTLGGELILSGSHRVYWPGKTAIYGGTTDGVLLIYNNASTDFNRLQFGGTTASFPALKRSTTNLVVRLADDSANTGLEANVVISRLNATSAAAPTIASATTIAPTNSIVFISGTTAIETITAPAPISATGGQITLIPTGIFTTTTAGNIALASTAVVSKALIMTYDSATTKWYPSY